MAKKKTISQSVDIFKPIRKLSKRFHLTLFFVLVVTCLAGAVLLINYTLKETANDPDYISPISAGTIDQATLDRVNTFHTSSDASVAPTLPAGRTNPVGE
jgi:hypothetical protein